jgi:glycosyltransferase involved in cell wall biosynthesis
VKPRVGPRRVLAAVRRRARLYGPKLMRELQSRLLPVPTPAEARLIDELRHELAQLEPLPAGPVPDLESVWLDFRRRFRRRLAERDPRAFLRWDLTRDSLYNPAPLPEELRALVALTDWTTRWRPALKESPIGRPDPCPAWSETSWNLIHHAFALSHVEHASRRRVDEFGLIVEFGGGYGSMARLAWQLGFRGRYVIFDLPEISALQRYYLKSVGLPVTTDKTADPGPMVSSANTLAELARMTGDRVADLFVATWSLSETPFAFRHAFLAHVRADHWLIAYEDTYRGVDNGRFFAEWRAPQDGFRWEVRRSPQERGVSYLVGVRASDARPGETDRGPDATSATRDRHPEQPRVRFSVVIPTYRRRDVVAANVAALARQEFDGPFEVIVVVDGSTDGTAEALRALEVSFPLTVVEQPNGGSAAARNHGAALARGELLLFLDDDMEAHPRLLAEHDASHRTGADAVLGHIPLHPASPPGLLTEGVRTWADDRTKRLSRPGAEPGLEDLLTGQLSVAATLFERLGGFDTGFRQQATSSNEDLDFGHRLLRRGHRVLFNPDAISWQRYVVTPRQYLRQWREAGRADVRLARKHPDQLVAIFTSRKLEQRRPWMRAPVAAVVRWMVVRRVEQGRTDRRTASWFRRVRWCEYWRGVAEAGGVPRDTRCTQQP